MLLCGARQALSLILSQRERGQIIFDFLGRKGRFFISHLTFLICHLDSTRCARHLWDTRALPRTGTDRTISHWSLDISHLSFGLDALRATFMGYPGATAHRY